MKKVIIIMLLFGIYSGINFADAVGLPNFEGNNSILNTAANANYLSLLEKEIVFEINKFRSNPTEYADKYIAPLVKSYNRNMLYFPNDKPLRTKEGVRALNECVRELRRQKSLPLVYPSRGLSQAADDHVKDQSKTGRIGHNGSDRSNTKTRIERYGQWNIRIAENIAYGGITAQQIVIYLLIDDGVRDRGHRKTFLQPDFRLVGVATGKHPQYGTMSVMDFAGAFTEK